MRHEGRIHEKKEKKKTAQLPQVRGHCWARRVPVLCPAFWAGWRSGAAEDPSAAQSSNTLPPAQQHWLRFSFSLLCNGTNVQFMMYIVHT